MGKIKTKPNAAQRLSMRGQPMSNQQGSTLFRLTLLKFWEPECLPAPDRYEASELIGLCFDWLQAKKLRDSIMINAAKDQLISKVRHWFPDWDGKDLANRLPRRNGKPGPAPKTPVNTAQETLDFDNPLETTQEPAESTETTDRAETIADEIETPEHDPEPVKTGHSKYVDEIISLIEAGIKNIWLIGPAGCGKSVMTRQAAEYLNTPCTVLSCSDGTPPTMFNGERFPAPASTFVIDAWTQQGISCWDEFTALPPESAQAANAMLANMDINTTVGHRTRHDDHVIIATSNTDGNGASRMYAANQLLDGSTRDRFVGSRVYIDYDREYERSHYSIEACRFVWRARDHAEKRDLRRIISTRMIETADKLRKARFGDWRERCVMDWTPEEKEGLL